VPTKNPVQEYLLWELNSAIVSAPNAAELPRSLCQLSERAVTFSNPIRGIQDKLVNVLFLVNVFFQRGHIVVNG
jgi:hypothetical protein